MDYNKEIDDFVLIQYIILYALAKVKNPIGYDTLINIVLEACNINYTEFQLALDNLCEAGHVRTFRGEGDKSLCQILPKGESASELFGPDIPVYIKDPIRESIRVILKEELERNRILAEAVPVSHGEYGAHCALYEDDRTPLLDLTFYAGTHSQAMEIAKRFKRHSDEIYLKIMELLNNPEFDEPSKK